MIASWSWCLGPESLSRTRRAPPTSIEPRQAEKFGAAAVPGLDTRRRLSAASSLCNTRPGERYAFKHATAKGFSTWKAWPN